MTFIFELLFSEKIIYEKINVKVWYLDLNIYNFGVGFTQSHRFVNVNERG
jgi:hypothetical protein